MLFKKNLPTKINDDNLSEKLDTTRINFVRATSHITQENFTSRQSIYELAYIILIYVTYDDDMKIDRYEERILNYLYEAIKQNLDKKEQKSFKRISKKYVSKTDIITYIIDKELPPSGVMKAVNIIESNIELNNSKIEMIKTLYSEFTQLFK
jgi:maltooligosyltrehalose synthase